MKRVLISTALILATASSLFAHSEAWDHGTTEGSLALPVSGRDVDITSARIKSQGNTGVALATSFDALYKNPANLGLNKKFNLEVVNLDFNFYGATSILKDPSAKEALGNLIKGGFSVQNLIKIAMPLITNLKNGTILDLAVRPIGFQAGPVAFEVFAKAEFLARNESGRFSDVALLAAVKAGASIGFGIPVYSDPVRDMELAVGASGSFYVDAYTDDISIDAVTGGELDFMNMHAMMGFAHPFTFGANLRYKFINAGISWRNLFNNYKMYYNDKFTDMMIFKGDSYLEVKQQDSLEIGIGINPKWRGINPRFELDVINLAHFDDVENAKDFFAKHTRMGAEVNLAGVLLARAGLDQGRLSFGAEFDLWLLKIRANYGWIEAGKNVGDSPLDYLNVSFSFGWGKTK